MNSWNNGISYANNMKIYNLDLPDMAYELLNVQEVWDGINCLIQDWGRENNYLWQAGFNGRSGGYLVLYQGGTKESQHKSYCPYCGQRNFKLVPPEDPTPEEKIRLMAHEKPWTARVIYDQFLEQINSLGFSEETAINILQNEKAAIKSGKEFSKTNKCGVCGNPRINFSKPPIEVFTYPGKSIDQYEDFEDWLIEDLRNRVKLVQSFDQLCDDIVEAVKDICDSYQVVEEEICVPKKIKVLQAI